MIWVMFYCGASLVITTFNEGGEVVRTIRSARRYSSDDLEVVIVDDGSIETHSCNDYGADKMLRHQSRVGIAASRDEGAMAAKGNVLVFFDAHQRVKKGAIEGCARLALERNAIVSGNIRTLGSWFAIVYGAFFRWDEETSCFSATWRERRPKGEVTQVTAVRAPAYAIPRDVYPRVRWIKGLRGWGGSEACISLKAFFTETPILHLRSATTWHLFRKKLPYPTEWVDVWRNHALIARVCFDQRTWDLYWRPVIYGPKLPPEVIDYLENDPEVVQQHTDFQAIKKRSDAEFWTSLLSTKLPPQLR